MASGKRDIGFTVNNESSTPIVTVRNISTGEVVRQIPNEVVIKLAKGLENFKGSLHNKQA
jgi:flagellar protein FlaG